MAAVTFGAGGLNIVNSAAQAYAEKSPVVFISGAPGTAEGKAGLGLHHQVKHLGSQAGIFREVTCAQAVLQDATRADAPLIGTYIGLAGDEGVRRIVETADTLLLAGVILCDTNCGVSERLI